MSNQARDIKSGLSNFGSRLQLSRDGFKTPAKKIEAIPLRHEQAHAEQLIYQENHAPKVKNKPDFDRITLEISSEQRAVLTNIATTLHMRVPKDKKDLKINRDMLIRAVMPVVEQIDWKDAPVLANEAEIRDYVLEKLGLKKQVTNLTDPATA